MKLYALHEITQLNANQLRLSDREGALLQIIKDLATEVVWLKNRLDVVDAQASQTFTLFENFVTGKD